MRVQMLRDPIRKEGISLFNPQYWNDIVPDVVIKEWLCNDDHYILIFVQSGGSEKATGENPL